MMAGWSSANNYALLGGQRAAALMISAEIAIGASIMGVVMVYGSLNLQEIVRGQGDAAVGLAAGLGHRHPAPGLRPLPHRRHRRHQAHPVRHAGGESEIIGYFVEYSGMKFGMFAHDRLAGDDR